MFKINIIIVPSSFPLSLSSTTPSSSRYHTFMRNENDCDIVIHNKDDCNIFVPS